MAPWVHPAHFNQCGSYHSPEEDTPVATPDKEMVDIQDGEAPDNEEEDMPKGVPERKSPENQEGVVPDVVVPNVMPANEVVQLPEGTPVPEDIVVLERTLVVKETLVPVMHLPTVKRCSRQVLRTSSRGFRLNLLL